MIGLSLALSLGNPVLRGGGGARIVLSTAVNGVVTVAEDVAPGTSLGELSVVGGSGVYVFTVTSDPDGVVAIVDDFDVENDALFDYETATSHTFTVEADNGVSAPLTAEFTIVVTDVTGTADPTIAFSEMLARNPELAFCPAVPDSCFQERTGASASTPCAANDPVGSLRNWGTLGGWLTAPSDAARPLLSVPGVAYLDYDGTNDVLIGALNALRASAGWTFVLGVRNTDVAGAASRSLLTVHGTSNTITRATMSFLQTSRLLQLAGRRIDANSTEPVNGLTHDDVDITVTGIGDFTNTDGFIRVNGASEASDTTWLTSGTTANDGGAVLLGGFNFTTPAAFFQGRIYSALAFSSVLSGADLALVEEWTAQQMGL